MTIVLAALDSSTAARPVLDTAIRIAELTGMGVEAVHVRGGPTETPETLTARRAVRLRLAEGPVDAALLAAIRDPEVMRLSTSNVRKLCRRLIERGTLVTVGERAEAQGRGRPGDLFRFSGPLNGTWDRELPW